MAAPKSEVASETDDTYEAESGAPVLTVCTAHCIRIRSHTKSEIEFTNFMTQDGWCEKKGRFGFFHPRYYTLTADGKVLAAKDESSIDRKHMFDLGEETTFEPTQCTGKTDLIIKGHNIRKESVNGFLY